MDYNDKRKYKKMMKKQRAKQRKATLKREHLQAKSRKEKREAKLVYQLREKQTPIRKAKNIIEE
tara:strand:+ start:113 stop:304 length:192 start_codon:yes stop_codon:yes gene_type:complete